MKLNKAPCGVTQTVSIFKGNVTNKDGEDNVKGGIVKGTKYAWLCQGPFLKIIDVSCGEKIAGWRFGAACLDFVSDVSCAVELPQNDDSSNLKQIVLGLECEVIGGMICIFDVQGSRLLRAIRIPGKPLSLSIVDSGSSGCEGRYPLPGLLSSMCGIIAVGLQGGSVFLIDLCRLTCDELLNTWFNDDREEVHDEMSPCQLLFINKDDDNSDKLEKKCATAAVSGDHLCLLLNEDAFVQDNFLLLEPGGKICACHKSRNIGVTSLLYVPRIASLIVGFSFGCFQLWNLMHLTLNFTSRMMKDPLAVMHLGFQEPSDDPCNFCYVWAVHSTTDEYPSSSPPVGIMYGLSYDSKEWVDGYGYLYQDYQSCHFRFEYNLEVDSTEDVDSICCVSFNTLSNVAIQRNMPEDGFDEVATENDFSLCIFAWEAYDSENKPISTYLALFDLNQWYKDQMPARVTDVEDENLGYLVTFSLNCIRQKGEESSSLVETPLLDIRVDPHNLSQFKSFQPQEEHFHPSALSFVSYCLLEDRIVSVSHPGLQRYLLLYMEKEGPICLLRPVNLFKHCVMVGLKPILMDINGSTEVSAVTQREFLLSVALENQMLGFLHRCASDWANGSVSGVDCSLPMLLSWGYQRAAVLKETADGLCVHLFDHTGIRLDKNECRLLDNCASQLRQLATLFEGILNDCRLLSLLNLEDFKQKTSELNLAALYFEVLQWFLNVGLLPEFPENDFDLESSDLCNTSVDKIPYPVTTLTKFYTDRRLEFRSLNLKNDTKACLYIDQLLQNENNGSELGSLWQSDGGSGMYPPTSIQSLLAMYLLDGIDIQTKNSIVIYVFLDLATLLDPERYSRTIEYFVKFPCAFCMTPSIIKVTQAFWLLDQKHFEDALDMVLDPLVSPKDLQPWQHRFIVHALLSQGQHNKALEYFTVRQLPIQGIEDIQLKISLLVMNKQVTQAYNFLHQYHNEENSKELLYHFYRECGKVQQLGTVLKLMLSPAEEELLMNFLQNCNISQSEDMQVVFYLMRSRVIEAVAVNERINFSGIRKSGFRRTRNDPTVRDVLVGGYGKTLPSVTRQLANYCSQQKKLLCSWRQVQRPTPMSVDVNYGTKQPVSYKSSLIHATLEKARETWMMPLHSSFNPDDRNKEMMDVTVMQNLPFLCTSHDNYRHDRETTPVVFPSVTSSNKRRLDDDGGSQSSTPMKRSRLESSPSIENFLLLSNKKSVPDHHVANSPLWLKSPLVKRITPLKQLNDRSAHESGSKPFAETFTPHSILKVRNLVRRSNSPEQSSGEADDLLRGEHSRSRQSEERLCARQIRFSFPVPNNFEENQPLSSSSPAHSVSRGKSPSRIVRASPRLPLRSSLSLLNKPVVETNSEMSSNYCENVEISKKSWSLSTSMKERICEDVFELTSEKSDKTDVDSIHPEDEKHELNDSIGEESFYSATSSSDSGASRNGSKITTDAEENSPSYRNEKYIHKIKEIKPRRQLSRFKPESQNKSAINKESEISVEVDEKEISSRSGVGSEKHRTLGIVDIKNLHKSYVNRPICDPKWTERETVDDDDDDDDDEDDGNENCYDNGVKDSVMNPVTSRKSILGDTFIEDSPLLVETTQNQDESSEGSNDSFEIDVQVLESQVGNKSLDKKEIDNGDDNDNSDDAVDDCVTNPRTIRKSILGDTFIENSFLFTKTTQRYDKSRDESEPSFENDSEDVKSEVSCTNKDEKGNNDDNDHNDDDRVDDIVMKPRTSRKSILGDTFIEDSFLFTKTTQRHDQSKKESAASFENDDENAKSQISCKSKNEEGNDDSNDRDYSESVDVTVNPPTTRKSILGDTFIENSFLFTRTRCDESKEESGASFENSGQDLEGKVSDRSKESSFVRIKQIKARRPLSRVRKSGNFISNSDNSQFEMDKSVNWGNRNYEKESIQKANTAVSIEDTLREETKEKEDIEDEVYKVQNNDGNVQGISDEYEKERNDAIEIVEVVEKHNANFSSNILPEITESKTLFTTSVESRFWKESSFQSRKNMFVSSVSQNLVQEVEYQESQRTTENNDELVMDGEKTYASLVAVSSGQSDYAHLLPPQNEGQEIVVHFDTESENQRNVLASNLIEGKVYPSLVTSTSITRSALESLNTCRSDEEICDHDRGLIDNSVQNYEVILQLDHDKARERSGSPVEHVSSSTAGDTSGTIELDSDESEEKNTTETSLKNEQSVAVKGEVEKESLLSSANLQDVNVESSEIVIIDSDTECNKSTSNEKNHECVEHESNVCRESFEEKLHERQEISEREQINPEEEIYGSSINETSPLILKLSDSENDAEYIEEIKDHSEMMEGSCNTEITPSQVNVNIKNKSVIASSIYSSNRVETVSEETNESQKEKHESKHSETLIEISNIGPSVCYETKDVADPVQQSTLNIVTEKEQQTTSNMEFSNQSGAALFSPQTVADFVVPEEQEIEQSITGNLANYSSRSFQNDQASAVHQETSQKSDVVPEEQEYQSRAQGEVLRESSQMDSSRRVRKSLQIETKPRSGSERIEKNKEEIVTIQEISTPRTRQRGRSSSVQSEPPQISDVLEAENQSTDEKVGTPHRREENRLRRRRSSLQIEPVQTIDENKFKEKEEVISGKISTPKSRLTDRRSSVHIEPVDTRDESTQEIEAKDEKCETSIEHSDQVVKMRRKSSLYIKPVSMHSNETERGNNTGIITGEICTPKSRQRARPSSTQSEPPLMSDVMTEIQTRDQKTETAQGQSLGGDRLRRRRSSLQIEPTLMSDESTSKTENEISREIVSSKTKRRVRPHSRKSAVVKEPIDNISEHLNEGRKQRRSMLQREHEENVNAAETKSKERNEVVEENPSQQVTHGNQSISIQDESLKIPGTSKEHKTLRDVSDNISKSSRSHKKEPKLPKAIFHHEEEHKMNLRSRRAQSEDRELPSAQVKIIRSPETLSDGDDYSIQSEPPQLKDVSQIRQLRSLRSRKGTHKKKKSNKSLYMLKISAPKLACVKEEPEELENKMSPDIGPARNLRDRKRSKSVSSQTSSVGEGHELLSKHIDKADSPSSMSSKSTLILDHGIKRKRRSSPSSPEEQEVKKYLKDSYNKSTKKSDADEPKEKSEKVTNSDDAIEQYATARRLTRYQKNVMERSIEAAKGVHHEFHRRHRHSETKVEDSDDESEASGYTSGSSHVRTSVRLQEKRLMMTDRSPSQSSSVSQRGNRTPKKRIIKYCSPVRMSPGEHSESSPASVRSGKSTSSVSSSQRQWHSPNSEYAQDSLRPRRKSFQKAQIALFSPSTKKLASPKTSDVATTDTSEGDADDEVTGSKHLKKGYGTASEAGSERSQSSAVSSTFSRNTHSSAKNTGLSLPTKSEMKTKHEGDVPPSRHRREASGSKDWSTDNSPIMYSIPKKEPTTSKDIRHIPPRESQEAMQNPESYKSYSVFRRRKFIKLHPKRKTK